MSTESAGERTLRAKYLDWCSARVADHFLRLSAEEIYQLARSGEADPAMGDSAVEADSGDVSYRVLVQRVTEVLLARLELPPYEEWKAEYRRSPERFDRELAGYWRQAEPDGDLVTEG